MRSCSNDTHGIMVPMEAQTQDPQGPKLGNFEILSLDHQARPSRSLAKVHMYTCINVLLPSQVNRVSAHGP